MEINGLTLKEGMTFKESLCRIQVIKINAKTVDFQDVCGSYNHECSMNHEMIRLKQSYLEGSHIEERLIKEKRNGGDSPRQSIKLTK